ncbi:RNA polymerase II transcription factor B subunit 3 [Trichomonascus vanleenenianus]|uniref:TFIIH/NER complex subunit TFB3 n=1 Tax=Trichomonascus vanleenenianus TaxID=2268995 RepID=UPI003ECA1170
MSRITVQTDTDNDVCPICKSSRYLNPDMKFLVNPECYHKMCESCVDRIFSLGPAPCPYPNCNKTLRKHKFTQQVFEDIGIEREVNVRQRVVRIFNKREQDFDSLEEYNNYLEEIENIVFNLVNSVDVEETERTLHEYERQNREKIMEIARRQIDEEKQQEALLQLQEQQRKQQLLMEIEEEKMDEEARKQQERELLRQLATSEGNAEDIIRMTKQNSEKRLRQRRRELEEKFAQKVRPPSSGAKTLAQRAIGANGTPFTPFNGDRQKEYLFSVQEDYFDPLMDNIRGNSQYEASGFRVEQAYQQALVQAFFGIGCNIQQEKRAPTPQAAQ